MQYAPRTLEVHYKGTAIPWLWPVLLMQTHVLHIAVGQQKNTVKQLRNYQFTVSHLGYKGPLSLTLCNCLFKLRERLNLMRHSLSSGINLYCYSSQFEINNVDQQSSRLCISISIALWLCIDRWLMQVIFIAVSCKTVQPSSRKMCI